MVMVAENEKIRIERLCLGAFDTNAYILICQHTGASVVIDAPGETEQILERLEGTNPKYILITHNHADHTGALESLKKALKVPIGVHASDADNLGLSPAWLLQDNEAVEFGDVRLTVLHTPGHTGGSVCFYTEGFLLAGDTLFPNGPGKTWSPSAFQQIMKSLENKLFTLPGDTQVFPGHGEGTNLGREKKAFDAFSAKPRDPNMYGDVQFPSP